MTEHQDNKLGELAAALAKAQAAFPAVKKDREATIASTKGSYAYRYADLATLIAAIRKPLADNGLAFTQALQYLDAGIVLESRLIHTGGGSLTSMYPLRSHDRPQDMGSEITYARRYTLSALVGVASEDDDDGAAASSAGEARKKKGGDRSEGTQTPRGGSENGTVEAPPALSPPGVTDPDRVAWASDPDKIAVGFGSQKGVVISSLDDSALRWYMAAYTQNVSDPKKARYKADNQLVLNALHAELERRKQQPEPTVEDLLPTPEDDQERAALVARISRLGEALGLKPAERIDTWQTYVGKGVKPDAASLEGLYGLRDYLILRIEQTGREVPA